VTADLQRLERALPAEARERLGIVLFSLDPARDHPQALRAFAREHGLDSTHWALYSSREDDMRTLAAVLGVRHRPDGDGEIAHSAIVAVVDTGGRIRHRQVGIQDDIAPLVAAVTAVTSSPRR
jgi:protein SCO1/2